MTYILYFSVNYYYFRISKSTLIILDHINIYYTLYIVSVTSEDIFTYASRLSYINL